MAVLVEAVSVIVRCDAIEERFAGGWKAFSKSFPTAAVCRDEHLVRIGFMDPSDANAYAGFLASQGLMTQRDNVAVDVTIVMQGRRPTIPTPWAKCGDVEINGMKLNICWLDGTEPVQVAVPNGWSYEKSGSKLGAQFVHQSLIGDRLKFLRRENNVDVYLDLQTNQEMYVGRPTIPGDTPEAIHTQLRRLFSEATKLDQPGPIRRSASSQKDDPRFVKLTAEILPAVERIVNGPGRQMPMAHFLYGAVLRLVDRGSEAVSEFLKAKELAPGVASILRDLVRCLGEMGKPLDALPHARKAAELEPTDPSILGNLAACLMQCGEIDEATVVIARALELDPKDAINNAIQRRLQQLRRT